jgi:ABC-type dipeptide/oligopeptide/nickel transport system permease subunit
LKNRPFIGAARVSGASSRRIVFKHIFPCVIHITLLYITIAVASALALEATFNFLGLTSPAVVTWGQMLSFSYFTSTARYGMGGYMAWWTIVPPALAIAYMVLSFFLISVGLRESMRVTSVRF